MISPLKEEREAAKKIIGSDKYIEVYVDTPLEVCIKRDSKGLYKRALSGEISNFTGISSPYEVPTDPNYNLKEDNLPYLINTIINLLKLSRGNT
jgi:adenylylsulfate kinase